MAELKIADVTTDAGEVIGEIRATTAAASWTDGEMRVPLVLVMPMDVRVDAVPDGPFRISLERPGE